MKSNKDSFLNKYFFYRVPKEDKKVIRQKIMHDDFNAIKVVLIIVCMMQVVMLVRSLAKYGFHTADMPWVDMYRALYSFLGISCGVALITSKEAYSSKNDMLYFSILNTMMIVIEIWAAGITILDSFSGIDLTTMGYIAMTIPVFFIVEPWIATIDLTSVLMLMNLHFLISPSYSEFYSSGTVINCLSILVLVILANAFSFYRRISKLNLELEIGDLNLLLRKKAMIDDLTGLYNRRHLTETIDTPLTIGKRSTGLLMLDIDSFKGTNDTYGHVAGDKVLAKLGEIILEFANNRGQAIRYGGEEFLIRIEATTKDELAKEAEELRKKVEETITDIGNDTTLKYTISIGVAMGNASVSYSGLISEADKALYEAKKTKNVVYVK